MTKKPTHKINKYSFPTRRCLSYSSMQGYQHSYITTSLSTGNEYCMILMISAWPIFDCCTCCMVIWRNTKKLEVFTCICQNQYILRTSSYVRNEWNQPHIHTLKAHSEREDDRSDVSFLASRKKYFGNINKYKHREATHSRYNHSSNFFYAYFVHVHMHMQVCRSLKTHRQVGLSNPLLTYTHYTQTGGGPRTDFGPHTRGTFNRDVAKIHRHPATSCTQIYSCMRSESIRP